MKAIYISLVLILSITAISCSGGGDSSPSSSTSTTDDTTDTDANLSTAMELSVTIPSITPSDEFICIDFDDSKSPLKMQEVYTGKWNLTLSQDMFESSQYKYCRNCECEAADEYFDGVEIGWRSLDFQVGTTQEDNVAKWRWYTSELTSFELNTTAYKTIVPPDMNKSNFMAGVMLNDWWKKEWLASVDTTMDRILNDTKSNWIQYTPIPEITQLYPSPLIVKDASNGTSDAELIQIISSAHAKGLKVFLNPSPWSFVEDNTPSDHNQTWWNEFEAQWRPIMLHYAQLAQDNSVEMLEFKMWPNIDALTTAEADKMNTLASTLLTDVRSIYTGFIAVQAIMYDTSMPVLDVHRNGDFIATNLWSYYPWHLGVTKDDNVTEILSNLESEMDTWMLSYYENNVTKPIIIEQLSAKSYDGGMVQLNSYDEAINPFYENNTSWNIDLQEQADVYEAALYAISKRGYVQGTFAFSFFYWNSIDKDLNIRGKPASGVVSKWYSWMKN